MKKFLSCLFMLSMLLFSGCQATKPITATEHTQKALEQSAQTAVADGNITVHFIDVGQADCILITQDKSTMLIDAGNNTDGEAVTEYLNDKGISKLDYLVGTHPHEDHIGGLDNVINAFDIGEIIMPRVTHTTKTYEDVLGAVKNKGMTITGAKAGQTYALGDASVQVLSPVSDKYDDLNEYSVVLRLTYGSTSFLFTGDMEKANENELLKLGTNVSANVLKVAHHGSNTSSTASFLQAVNAEYGIICVGEDNDYGHPHSQVLKRLETMMKLYRTDHHGTVTVTSDGSNITVATERMEQE